ncbi:MAG TPA: hypothetical protein VMG12_36230 [Polyangiaceae bacterium]|nr:hypothetical protein [Polyangiaceae bacterium]
MAAYADELPAELDAAPEAFYDEWVSLLFALARGAMAGALPPPVARGATWSELLKQARSLCLEGLERGFALLERHPASSAVTGPLLAALCELGERARAGDDGVVRELGGLHELLLGLAFSRLTSSARRLRRSRVWLSPSDVLGWPASVRSKRLQRELGLSKHSVHAFGPLLAAATTASAVESCLKSLFDPRQPPRDAGRWVLTASGRRRTSGAHYTPWPLCVELVERTLTPLVAALPEPRSTSLLTLRVCDPAMGAGAFLIAATRYLGDVLLDAWRRERRAESAPETAQPEMQAAERLALARSAIATHVIRGVDKNRVAVSIARQALCSLLGKEHEFGARLCAGDALLGAIGSRSPAAPGGANNDGLSWAGAFEDVFQRDNPGFDAILGNPPWVAYVGRAAQPLAPELAAFHAANNPAFRRYRTLHGLFVYRSAELLRAGGRLGLVLPTSVADLAGYAPTREAHDALCSVDRELPDWGDGAFDGVFQPCMALLSTRRALATEALASSGVDAAASSAAPGARVWPLRNDQLGATERRLLERLARLPRLPPEAFGERGFQTTEDDLAHLARLPLPRPPHSIALREGADIGEFRALPPQLFADASRLGSRLRKPADWQQVKLLIRQTARFPMAALSDGLGFRNSILAGFETPGLSAALLLGLLNSALLRWLHYTQQRDARQGMPQLKVGHLRALPAPPSDAGQARAAVERLALRLGVTNGGIDAGVRAELDAAVCAAFGLDAADRDVVARWASDHPPPLSRRRLPNEQAPWPAPLPARAL